MEYLLHSLDVAGKMTVGAWWSKRRGHKVQAQPVES